MYFDWQNLEAETAEEEPKIIAALKEIGAIEAKLKANPPTIKVSEFTFLVSEGGSGFLAITGLDEKSDDILPNLFAACGGAP